MSTKDDMMNVGNALNESNAYALTAPYAGILRAEASDEYEVHFTMKAFGLIDGPLAREAFETGDHEFFRKWWEDALKKLRGQDTDPGGG